MVYIDQTIYTCIFCNDWEKHDYPGQKANLNLAFKASIKLSKFLCSKLMKIIFREGRKYSENIKNTLFIKNETIIHKKNNWHCQRQKSSRILSASDFVTWTARYILDLVFYFSYTGYKFICYLLLMLITFRNFTVNINVYQNATSTWHYFSLEIKLILRY